MHQKSRYGLTLMECTITTQGLLIKLSLLLNYLLMKLPSLHTLVRKFCILNLFGLLLIISGAKHGLTDFSGPWRRQNAGAGWQNTGVDRTRDYSRSRAPPW